MLYLLRLMIVLFLMGTALLAQTKEITIRPVSINLHDKASLQRGAKIFINYCSGCHSLKYMRYNRMATDLGLVGPDGTPDASLLKNNLIFTQAAITDSMHVALLPEEAKQWFGVVPPDLSLSARVRGADWIYNYLKSFYSDDSRPFGVNNLLYPDVAMPNVLEPLLGTMIMQRNKQSLQPYLLLSEQGEMNQEQSDDLVRDLVSFLVYVAEPAKLVRYHLGLVVIFYLSILLGVAYCLKKIYWNCIDK